MSNIELKYRTCTKSVGCSNSGNNRRFSALFYVRSLYEKERFECVSHNPIFRITKLN